MIRVLIADSQTESREQLRAHLASDPEIEIAGLACDGQEALQLVHQLQPDIALLATDLAVTDGFQTVELLVASPHLPTQCVLLADVHSAELMRLAMRAGAREFLARPLDRTTLLQTLHNIYEDNLRRQSPTFLGAADPSKAARLIAVTGAKGGIGKTTMAANLAVAFALETGEPTVLLDLYTQYGDVPMLMDVQPRRSLIELASMGMESLDARLLDDCMERHESGVQVLTTAKNPVALDALTVPYLENTVRLLKQHYRFIVVDVPPVLHAASLYVVSHATTVLVLANLFDITTVNDTRRMLETLAGRYVSRDKIRLIVNRLARQNQMQLSEIEQALGFPMFARIPNDGEIVPKSINQGVPFVHAKPNSPVSRSVRQLAIALASGSEAVTEMEAINQQTPPNWFARLFGGQGIGLR